MVDCKWLKFWISFFLFWDKQWNCMPWKKVKSFQKCNHSNINVSNFNNHMCLLAMRMIMTWMIHFHQHLQLQNLANNCKFTYKTIMESVENNNIYWSYFYFLEVACLVLVWNRIRNWISCNPNSHEVKVVNLLGRREIKNLTNYSEKEVTK